MPRATRAASLGLRANNIPMDGGLNNKKRKMTEENGANAAGVKAKSAPKRRPALGEITNAFVESTNSKVQKGLSKMLNKSKSKPKLTNSSNNSSSTNITSKTTTSEESSIKSEPVPIIKESPEEIIAPKASPEAFHEAVEDIVEDEEYESAEENVEEEPKSLIPEGVVDFDAQNPKDPVQAAEYVKEIFAYYKTREAEFRVPDYISEMQDEVTPQMRAILVDWLVEVQESFELNHETLYTAVKMMDIYLSRVAKVPKAKLQLIGAVACLIACKVDERIPPLLDDFVYVCDDAYTKDDIKKLEIKMIDIVGYDVGYPLTYRYLRRYGRVSDPKV